MLLGPTVFVELFPVLVSNRTTKWSATVQTLEDFGRRGNSLVPLGALLMLAALSLGVVVTVAVTSLLRSGVSQMPAHVSEQWSDQLTEELLSFHVPSLPALGIGDLLLLVIMAPMAFLIGRWMGRDLSPSVPSAQGAGNVVAAYLCGMVMPMFLVLAVASTENPIFDGSQFLVSTLILVLLLFASLVGYRRGRELVLGAYMAYLLNRASYEAQQDILKLAHEEAVAYQGKSSRQGRVVTLFER